MEEWRTELQSYHLGIEISLPIRLYGFVAKLQSYHLGIEIGIKDFYDEIMAELQSYHLGIEMCNAELAVLPLKYSNRTI